MNHYFFHSLSLSASIYLIHPQSKELLIHHNEVYFPFLKEPGPLHLEWYKALGNLLFNAHNFSMFTQFFQPFERSLTVLDDTSVDDFGDPDFESPLQILLDDLTALVDQCGESQMRAVLLEHIVAHISVFTKIAQVWMRSPEVTDSLIQLFTLPHQTEARPSSLSLIIFRVVAVIVDQQAPTILANAERFAAVESGTVSISPADENSAAITKAVASLQSGKISDRQLLYDTVINPASKLLKMVGSSLDGGTIPANVCTFYKDNTLPTTLGVAFRLFFSFSSDDLLVCTYTHSLSPPSNYLSISLSLSLSLFIVLPWCCSKRSEIPPW